MYFCYRVVVNISDINVSVVVIHQDVAYGVITLLVNLTNSYEKQEIMPELIELAKFAKHHIPQEHELDDQDFIDKRIWVIFRL